MWNSSRRVLQDLITLTHSPVKCFSQTTCKNTVKVERWWQVPLSKEGSPPRLYPRRHRVYKLVEDTKTAPKEKMELILTQTVERLGGRGDTVFVKKSIGRNKLLSQGLAVYPSPENKEMIAKELRLLHEVTQEGKIQTRTGEMTVALLKSIELKISKPLAVDYQLTKEIVCRNFLKTFGIVVPPHALRLPDEPIKELGDYWCEVTVNGMDTVRVPMSLLPYVDPSASYQRMLKRQRKEHAEAAVAPIPGAAVTEAVGAAVKKEAILEAVTEPASVSVEAEALKESLLPLVESSTTPAAASAPEAMAASHPSEAATVEATAALPILEEATAASPALEEATAASPILEEATAALPALEETTAASPALEEATAASPALEEVAAALPALEQISAASPALEEATAASPALEEVTAASAALEEVTAASPALEEVTAASPALEEVSAASPALEVSVASPALEDVSVASPALEEVSVASPAQEEVSAASPALEEVSAASPALEEVSAASPAQEEATAASPALEEVSVASPALEEVFVASPVLEKATAASPALEEVSAASPALEDASVASPALEEVSVASPVPEEATAAKAEKTATSPEYLITPQTTEDSKAVPPSETQKKD